MTGTDEGPTLRVVDPMGRSGAEGGRGVRKRPAAMVNRWFIGLVP